MEWASSKWTSAKRRRRTAAVRLLIFALVAWFCYDTAMHQYSQVTEQGPENAVVMPSPTPEQRLETSNNARHGNENEEHQAPLHESVHTANGDIDHDSIHNALHRMLTLLPDELHVRDLLRPIAGTGEERLREMGLRTRSFKVLLGAWEDLHVVPGNTAMYVRDDVIQYIRRHPDLADGLQTDLAQLIRSYESFRSVITRLSMLLFPWTSPYFADHTLLHTQLYSGGRGLVFSAGDAQAPFLLTSIPSIRRLGCNLPIEVLYLGDGDLSEDSRSDLEALPGVITRDLSQMVNDNGWTLAGWAGKPFAILLSSFREAIFIDADSLFFQNPEILFEDPGYLATGALFFKDRLMMPEAKKRWLQRVIPKPISKNVVQSRLWTGESGHMQESGVVVVDKWKHFVSLLLVTRMNGPDRDGDSTRGKVGVYDMVYGDKETFWLGWELAGDPGYAFHDGDAGIMGTLEPAKPPPKTPESTAEVTTEVTAERIAENIAKKNTAENIAKNTAKNTPKITAEDAAEDATEDSIHTRDTSPEPEVVIGPELELSNYTICAPQLLHLDRQGKPLWFNGWLLPNKFAEHKNQAPATFEAYIREPREIRDPGAWQLHENNICCLTAEHKADFSEVEKSTLAMIMENGRRSGALKAEV